MRQYKVVLVDDEITIREGFKRLFDWAAHGCEVVGEAADGVAAINIVDTLHPDIVIMDINMPLMNGLEVIQILKRKYPKTAYLKEHLSEEITLKKLAEEFHLSPNYVGQVLSDRIGVNYQAYLMNLRMEEAKSLLLTTQKPIAEISELVGYKDYRVFTRTFKRLEKVTPTSFRKIT